MTLPLKIVEAFFKETYVRAAAFEFYFLFIFLAFFISFTHFKIWLALR